jgi:hypothetical protein
MNEQEFWAALAPLPPPPSAIRRLYYDDNGWPLYYSGEDLPGNYIDLTPEEFTGTPANIRIVDKKIVLLKIAEVSKLRPSKDGTPCHPDNVSIVVGEDEFHQKWIYK